MTSISVKDLSSMTIDFMHKKCLVVSKRGSGKSWLCAGIVKKGGVDREILIVSPTEKYTKFWGTQLPNADIRYSLELGNIDDKKSLIVLDDCFSSKNNKDVDEFLGKLLSRKNVSVIVIQQFLLLDKHLVAMFDYVFIGKEDFISSNRRIYERIPNTYSTFELFRSAIQSLEPYYFLMWQLKGKSKCANVNNNNIQQYKHINSIDINLKDHKSLLIVNSNESENTTLVKNIMYHHNFESCLVINEYGTNNYPDFVDKVYKPKILLDSLFCGKSNTLVVLEYCLHKFDKKILAELFFNGRCYGITFVIVDRVLPSLPPDYRANIDLLVLGSVQCINNALLKRTYDHYFGMLSTYTIFKELMMYITGENHLLMLDRRSRAEQIYIMLLIDKEYKKKLSVPDMVYMLEMPSEVTLETIMKYLQKIDQRLENIENTLASRELV
jgi:hypothetical protein